MVADLYVRVTPSYAPGWFAVCHVIVPAGDDQRERACLAARVITRACLERYGLIQKETN